MARIEVTKSWKLYLDDVRECPEGFSLAKSTIEAISLIQKNGFPSFMSLDHDLEENDTTMIFLKKLAFELWNESIPIPEYTVHSANPVGRDNIIAFMETWKKFGG